MNKEKYIAYAQHYVRKIMPTILLGAFAILSAISLYSFYEYDLSWLYHARYGTCHNQLGYFGSSLAAMLVYFFGSMAYAVPLLCLYATLFTLHVRVVEQELDTLFGVALGFLVLCVACAYHQVGYHCFSGYGGLVGLYGLKSIASFDSAAQAIIIYVLLTVALTLIVRFAHLQLARYVVQAFVMVWNYSMQVDNIPARIVRALATVIAWVCMSVWRCIVWSYHVLKGTSVHRSVQSIVQFERDDESIDHEIDTILHVLHDKPSDVQAHEVSSEHNMVQPAQQDIVITENSARYDKKLAVAKYHLPDIEKMLSFGNYHQIPEVDQQQFVQQAMILEEKLSLFGVKGKVVRVHPGPVITLFEYRPDVTIKLSKILGLEDDLAMALQALSIRIIAPIPGKDVVGFEVSNKVRKSVLLSDIFHSTSWTKFKGSLPLILGEDTAGNHIVVDLAAMPHLLIAGSTGSGKSVALNCMLVSLLCSKTPEELKLIIIDPKQIEFTAYEKIAHLLFPVVSDTKKTLPIFKWLVMTMEERYERMASVGAKNIFDYHRLEQQRSDLEHMPFIVVMIDELADLMMTTGRDIEGLIARLAQMSRAAGIHMIVATQRPSVDVITGLIKVNFPNRISFKVTSKVDSRTILDEVGAERLLGKGDMLFIDAKDPHIRRVHGAYVSEKELHYLIQHVQAQQAPEFLDLTEFFTSQDDDQLLETDQELFSQVVDMLRDCDEVSISMIQRRFRIGFNRSARIIETLQARGLIMPSDGGKMRRVVKD
ncbi:DNA translocase FtsK 4TM domain-containing protein [Candidatus Babeliales bacterium]|nr:DNA translocase FtsK 4TM domain-containing protein [Candidatus Babeliales bacterium]